MKKSLIALAALAASGCAVPTSRRSWEEQGRGHELRALNMGGLEANLKAQRAAGPAYMPGDGRGSFIHDKIVLGAVATGGVGNPALSDVIKFLIPAGTKVCTLEFVGDDGDTGTTQQAKIGYEPVSSGDGSLAANDAYFAAAAAFMQTAGRVECTFKPIKFEQDVYITVTITAAPTGVSGNPELHMIAGVIAEGTK